MANDLIEEREERSHLSPNDSHDSEKHLSNPQEESYEDEGILGHI